MKSLDKYFNFISNKNNAKIAFYTSQSNICYCSNILSENVKVSQQIIYYLLKIRVYGYLNKVSRKI
jgi:hypothetical protein